MLRKYASYFVSYLLKELEEISNLNKIILFGSAARGEAVKDSDVDIFIEIKRKDKRFERRVDKILNDFYKSREGLIFKAKGLDNKINLIIGKLEEWKDLKKSIESSGIILYGKYAYGGKGERKYAIIFWDKVGVNRGAFLNRLYGFRVGKKKYLGFLKQRGGRKLGKSSVMLPIEYRDDLLEIIKHYKVNAKIIEVYE